MLNGAQKNRLQSCNVGQVYIMHREERIILFTSCNFWFDGRLTDDGEDVVAVLAVSKAFVTRDVEKVKKEQGRLLVEEEDEDGEMMIMWFA